MAPSLAAAAAEADTISCATLSNEPVIEGAWLSAGSHLDLMGSITPGMREADDASSGNACLCIDIDEALVKHGNLPGPLSRGVFDRQAVRGTLASLCRGEAAGRRDAIGRTVCKSVGTALEDLAAAVLVNHRSD